MEKIFVRISDITSELLEDKYDDETTQVSIVNHIIVHLFVEESLSYLSDWC